MVRDIRVTRWDMAERRKITVSQHGDNAKTDKMAPKWKSNPELR